MAQALNNVLKNQLSYGQMRDMLFQLHKTRSLNPSDFRIRYAVFHLREAAEWSEVAPLLAQYNFSTHIDEHSRAEQLDHLTTEIRALDDTLRPPQEQYDRKHALVEKITPLLERKMGGSFRTFGSCENGFWMRKSDVDSCMLLPHCAHRQSQLSKLRLAAGILQRAGLGTVEVVPARVPVAKLKKTGSDEEQGDISINNTIAVENSMFVATLSGLDERVRPMGRVIKHWASQRQINSRSQGTLSTYTIILQLFYLMQLKNILPKFADISIPTHFDLPLQNDEGIMRPPPFNVDFPPVPDRGNESIGSLVYEFFRNFGDDSFRGGDEGTTVDDATTEPNDLGVLVMKCPLSGKNVNPMTIEVWQAIHSEFARAKMLLENGAPLGVICEKAEAPPINAQSRSCS